ncbi:GDSL-type esterase/lipase family protein [Bacillus testis]|uniref:GDSL-type esterase/lipase family protein n=1 Tax=Bacillus testis TaxID=1622072 RepID=UPI00067E7AD9|nr:GDSL-type esterase/lipase family protein [Bacillus testis]
MKQVSRKVARFALLFTLLIGLITAPVSAAEQTEANNYLSLGDSLAAGMNSDNKVDSNGFSDVAAKYLSDNKMIGSYSKEFAVPGYTTSQVLKDLNEKAALQDTVKKSKLISISVSANDLLSIGKMNEATGMMEIDRTKLVPTLGTISANYSAIMKKIKELNPNADVYVMGYYFPYPYMNDQQKPELIQMEKGLNELLRGIAVTNNATFVDVYSKFGDDTKPYLPNPKSIHPNAAGYKLMADALIEAIAVKHAPTPIPTPMPQPIPTPKMPVDLDGHWAVKQMLYMVEHDWLAADANGKVYPDHPITRAEAAKILVDTIITTQVMPKDPGFTDVPNNHPAYHAIAVLTEKGVFAKAKTFKPNDPLQRVQLAKVIASTYQLKATGKAVAFKDVTKAYWAYNEIQAVATNKLMIGSNNRFDLYSKTTRAQFASVIYRALEMNKMLDTAQ